MKNTPQQRNRLSRMRLSAARAVLGLALVLVSAVTTTQSAQAQTFTTLHSFDNTDGKSDIEGLVQASNGDLYGTTNEGGASGFAGTVFKITPGGTLTT